MTCVSVRAYNIFVGVYFLQTQISTFFSIHISYRRLFLPLTFCCGSKSIYILPVFSQCALIAYQIRYSGLLDLTDVTSFQGQK